MDSLIIPIIFILITSIFLYLNRRFWVQSLFLSVATLSHFLLIISIFLGFAFACGDGGKCSNIKSLDQYLNYSVILLIFDLIFSISLAFLHLFSEKYKLLYKYIINTYIVLVCIPSIIFLVYFIFRYN